MTAREQFLARLATFLYDRVGTAMVHAAAGKTAEEVRLASATTKEDLRRLCEIELENYERSK